MTNLSNKPKSTSRKAVRPAKDKSEELKIKLIDLIIQSRSVMVSRRIAPKVLLSKIEFGIPELTRAFERLTNSSLRIAVALYNSFDIKALKNSDKSLMAEMICVIITTAASKQPNLIENIHRDILQSLSGQSVDEYLLNELHESTCEALMKMNPKTPEYHDLVRISNESKSIRDFDERMVSLSFQAFPACEGDLEYFVKLNIDKFRFENQTDFAIRKAAAKSLFEVIRKVCALTESAGNIISFRPRPANAFEELLQASERFDLIGMFDVSERCLGSSKLDLILDELDVLELSASIKAIRNQADEIEVEFEAILTHPALAEIQRFVGESADLFSFDAVSTIEIAAEKEALFETAARDIMVGKSAKAVRRVLDDFQRKIDEEAEDDFNDFGPHGNERYMNAPI